MTSTRFSPLNDLECGLLALQGGELSLADLLARLVGEQVFILLDRDPGPEEARDDKAAPLVLNNPQGLPVLAIFTAPERAISMTATFPQFAHGVWVEFAWLLRLVRPGFGIVMNPGTLAGFEMPPETVGRLQSGLPH
ncbi:MAG: hypothetical protein K0S16_278 [Moraxellaceae bacterium]|jgi:hypothetical protein|nr:hypothetical protein [Moraxellaceae bacterium]